MQNNYYWQMPGMHNQGYGGQGQGGQGQGHMMDMNMHPGMMNQYQQQNSYNNNHNMQGMYQNQGMMDPNAMNMNQEVHGDETEQI
jgi:hypothetical protein